MFALILVFQYFELPYGSFPPSLIPTGKVLVLDESSLQNGDVTPESKIIGNVSLSRASNYTGTYVSQDTLNYTRVPGPESEGLEPSTANSEKQNRIVKPENVKDVEYGIPQEEARQPEQNFINGRINVTYNYSTTSDQVGTSVAGFPSPSPVTPSANSSPYTKEAVLDRNTSTPAISGNFNTSLVEKNGTITSEKNENSEAVLVDLRQKDNSSFITKLPKINNKPEMPKLDVYSLSDMNNLLLQSHSSYYSVVRNETSALDVNK